MDAEPSTRSVDIELGGHEVVTIELDNLDPNPDDILDLLREGDCKVSVWTKLACEYWRRGFLEAAERIAKAATEMFTATQSWSSLPPIYLLLANIQIAHARKAPKFVLLGARRDIISKQLPKEKYHSDAAKHLNTGDRTIAEHGGDMRSQKAFLTRGVHQLATRSFDDALQSFEGVLAERPTNLVALTGKARILYSRKQFPQALKLFQQVLILSPNSLPDPRIGIGLCLWAMDHKAKAKAAWLRSLEVVGQFIMAVEGEVIISVQNPTEWAANLLLGLEAINASKNAQSDDERLRLYGAGTKFVEKAFNSNKQNAAAANALCDFFMLKGDHKQGMKLAERTIQFADTLPLLCDGYIRAGQIAQAEGLTGEAIKHFTAALKNQPKNVLAAIGLAQMQIQNDEIPAAIHTLDTLRQPPNPQRSLEAMVMLASLRAFPRPGVSSADARDERLRARDLFDHVLKLIEAPNHKPMPVFTEDIDMYVEIARLWQDDNLERMRKALQDAMRISQSAGQVDPRLLNNIAALRHLEGELDGARATYGLALTNASALEPAVAESMSTSILYNLARVYEDQGEEVTAKEAYDKLLTRHPEYVDAKIRQAQLLANLNRHNEAHELVKQALASQNSNLNLRAFYTYFLVQNAMIKPAKDFVFTTLKDFDKHDVYALCAAGWLHYHQARESRDASAKALEDRRSGYRRAAEFYEKALQRDELCAFAGQGLAIVTAEDVLGGPSTEEALRRQKNTRDALDVFGKIRESVNDMSVYLNMGHCYYARDEFDRAIESYETAAKRCHNGQNVMVLMCLCRSWYAKANKDQSITGMSTALKYAQTAMHLQPNDKAVLYNIAMIEQKAAEMLFAIVPSKRTLRDLQRGISQGIHAQKLFASLAADKSTALPYNKDIADQRRKYGESMLRKGDEHLAAQQKHEGEVEEKLRAARQKRQDEKDRQIALEREKEEEHRKQAGQLAEERRKAREEAQAWSLAARGDSDEERERKPRKSAKKDKQPKQDVGSGDEALEPKKKRKGKLKKDPDADVAMDDTLFSGEEGEDKPLTKRPKKKRVVRDDDEEEMEASAPRKKQFKSKELISDSDDDM